MQLKNIIFLLVPTIIFAQLDSILQNTLCHKELIQNPYLTLGKSIQTTHTSIHFTNEKLHFKRNQTAENTHIFDFSSKGIFSFSTKLIISGNINFQKITEKEVGNTLVELRTNENFSIPLPYYYVQRKANWNKQKYSLNGLVAYTPTKNTILQANIYGKYDENFRNTDARPKIQNIDYQFNTKLGYHFNNYYFLINLGYHNFHKNLNIYYENTELNNLITHPDTFLIKNEGYGNNYAHQKNGINNVYKNVGNNFGGEYTYQSEKILIRLSYQNIYSLNEIYDDFSLNSQKKESAVKTQQDNFNLFFRKNGTTTTWETLLNYRSISIINFLYNKNSSSNKQTENQLYINNKLYINKLRKNTTTLGFEARIGSFRSQDTSVVLDKAIRYAEGTLFFGKNFSFLSDKNYLFFNIENKLYIPINQIFNYIPFLSNSENIFVKNIALLDHIYDTSTRYSPTLQVGFSTIRNKKIWKLFTNFSQTYFIKNQYYTTKNYLDLKSNFSFHIGMSIDY